MMQGKARWMSANLSIGKRFFSRIIFPSAKASFFLVS